MFLFARHPCIDNPLAYIIFVMPAQQGAQNGGLDRVPDLFELPTKADTGNRSAERPCFLSDHSRPPCTEDRGNRLKGILNHASTPHSRV